MAAAVELEEKSKMLCELDSVAGDGDHGVTIARMAESMKNKVEAHDSANIKDLLDDLSMAFMNSNGGSAGPLWGTVFGGLADASPEDAKEVSLEELHAMLAQAKEDFEDISKAKSVIRRWLMLCILHLKQVWQPKVMRRRSLRLWARLQPRAQKKLLIW